MDIHRDRNARHEQIEREIALDPARSNREIARLIGCDHKTVGAVRDKTIERDAANSPNGDLGRSPEASGEIGGSTQRGEIPQGGEMDHDDRGDRFGWGNLPDVAYIIPPQGMTAAFIEEQTGDLIIVQDHTHLWSDDVVIRIAATEVEDFVNGLVAMVRAR
jgi:hypothetical protein